VSAFERATWWQLLVDPLASLSLGRWPFPHWDREQRGNRSGASARRSAIGTLGQPRSPAAWAPL